MLQVVGEYKISNDLRLSGNVTPHPGVPSVEGAGNYRAARESRMHMNVTSEEGFTYGATFVKLRYSVTANSGKHRLSKMEVIGKVLTVNTTPLSGKLLWGWELGQLLVTCDMRS